LRRAEAPHSITSLSSAHKYTNTRKYLPRQVHKKYRQAVDESTHTHTHTNSHTQTLTHPPANPPTNPHSLTHIQTPHTHTHVVPCWRSDCFTAPADKLTPPCCPSTTCNSCNLTPSVSACRCFRFSSTSIRCTIEVYMRFRWCSGLVSALSCVSSSCSITSSRRSHRSELSY
jgi:hypothetical protein